ncbi:hypothetical protein [Amedibacillus sp. YH-ame10]
MENKKLVNTQNTSNARYIIGIIIGIVGILFDIIFFNSDYIISTMIPRILSNNTHLDIIQEILLFCLFLFASLIAKIIATIYFIIVYSQISNKKLSFREYKIPLILTGYHLFCLVLFLLYTFLWLPISVSI